MNLSIKEIGRKYLFGSKPYFFNFLKMRELIVENGDYELTKKGIENGGSYAYNEKGEKYIEWDEDKIIPIIKEFKLLIFKRVKISEIYHMTHITNLDSILKYGLLSHTNIHKQVDISNKEVNDRRGGVELLGKSLHEYVPFYFNPRNAMLYRNQEKFGNSEIIILGFSVNKIVDYNKLIFTNLNASADKVKFATITGLLKKEFINFSKVFSDRWVEHGVRNDILKQKMMAEILIEDSVKSDDISVIYCHNDKIKEYINNNFNLNNIKLITEPKLFF